jgi:hypothetical protein
MALQTLRRSNNSEDMQCSNSEEAKKKAPMSKKGVRRFVGRSWASGGVNGPRAHVTGEQYIYPWNSQPPDRISE